MTTEEHLGNAKCDIAKLIKQQAGASTAIRALTEILAEELAPLLNCSKEAIQKKIDDRIGRLSQQESSPAPASQQESPVPPQQESLGSGGQDR